MKVIFTHLILAGLGLNVLAAPSKSSPILGQLLTCDGGRANPTKCPALQLCFHDPNTNPDVSNQAGVCIGQPCEGFTPHPQYCPEGQVCVRPVNDSASTANLPGHCVSTRLPCTATSGACDEGWSCVAGPRSECKMSEPGCPGLCEPNSWEPKAIAVRQASSTLTNTPAEGTLTPSVNHNPIHCGGFLNDPALYGLCPHGQVCAQPYWAAHLFEYESACIGQPCGGLTVVSAPCPEEQVCIPPTGHKSFSNPFNGTCVPQMWSCSAKQACKEGWTCVANSIDSNCQFGVDGNCSGICQNSWAFWEAQTASRVSTDATQILPTTTPTIAARQLVAPTATAVAVPITSTRPTPTECDPDKNNTPGTECTSPDEWCSWGVAIHGVITDPLLVSQCLGKRCRSFFPSIQDCPQGQVCIKPVNGKDASKEFPGRCAPVFWGCPAGSGSWCGVVPSVCQKNPAKDCLPGAGACRGVCAPLDWVYKPFEPPM